MITNKKHLTGMAAVAILAMTFGTLTVGAANADDETKAQVNANSLAKHVEKVEPHHGKRLSLHGMQTKGHKSHVSVPQTANGVVKIGSHSGYAGISLPQGVSLMGGKLADNGTVVYQPADARSGGVVVEALEDGSVQLQTIIKDAQSTHDLAYKLDVSESAKMKLLENGSVVAIGQDGRLELGLAKPWAVDAEGKRVKTYFTMDGNTVTQHVKPGPDTAYPIVADPWIGGRLFSRIWSDRYQGDLRYNGNVSRWGAFLLADPSGTGQSRMLTAGWKEWTDKYPAIKDKPTLRQQYACHIAAGAIGIPFTGTWNLERFRADKPDWYRSVVRHRCNW